MTTAPAPNDRDAAGRPGGASVNMTAAPAGQSVGLVSPRLKAADDGLSNHLLEEAGQRLDQIAARLHEMSLTLESVRVSMGGLTAASDDHEERLRRLESWKHRVHAVGTLLAFALGAALTAAFEAALG